EQRLALGTARALLVGLLFDLGQCDPEALRQMLHRIEESKLLLQLEKLDHVAADAAAEAVKEALVAVDVERRRLLTVKWTQPFVRGSRLLQRHVVLDHDDDVRLSFQVLDEVRWEERHQSFNSTTVTPPPPLSIGAASNRATSGCSFSMAAMP